VDSVTDADMKQAVSFLLQTLDTVCPAQVYRTCYNGGTDAQMSVLTILKSGVYHLLHVYHIHENVRINFSVTEGFLSDFFKKTLY
jgi:hypothetical protein